MKDSTAKVLLGVVAGGAAIWGVSRWRNGKKGTADRRDAWGDDHDEEPIEPRYDDAREPGATQQTPSSRRASRALTRSFDQIFTVYGLGLPVPYLRALAARESGLDPLDPKGLINVVRVVREDFNALHGANVAPSDLKNPVVNVMIASDALRRIIDSLAHHHPDVPNLREDWSNRHFVELLTFGWNAGWSESAGLGRVATYLERQGHTDITLAAVARAAYPAGAKHWLWNPKKVAWTRSVADLYFDELARDVAAGRMARPSSLSAGIATAGAWSSSTPAPDALRFGRPVSDDVRLVVSGGWPRPRDGGRVHRALDLPLPAGTPILAIDAGTVVHVESDERSAAGKWIAVKHASGITSRYLHLSRTDVAIGQQLDRGEQLGLSGDTGNSSGPHLHLDLRAPLDMLVLIESWVGRPAGGWGSEMKPFGYSIPGESWIPVDEYRPIVIEEAAAAGIRLHGTTDAEPPLVATAAPVAHPEQADEPVGG
jgi:murein DD-endopeptidase MepM/ murein hydrolase activator NlpD